MLSDLMKEDILKTDADRLYELILKEKNMTVSKAAKELKIDTEETIRLGEILEEDGLLKVHYPPVGEPLLIYGEMQKKGKAGDNKNKRKSRRGQMKALGIALAFVFLMLSIAYKNRPDMFNSLSLSFDMLSEPYLDMDMLLIISTLFTIIIIVVMAIALHFKKKGAKRAKGLKDGKGRTGSGGGKKKPERKNRKIFSILKAAFSIRRKQNKTKQTGNRRRVRVAGRQTKSNHTDNKG